MWFFLLLGAIVFLIMQHPIVFWVVFVPLALMFVAFLVNFFRKGVSGLVDFATALIILGVMVVALMIVCIPEECDHTETQIRYVFASEDSTAMSSVAEYCRECDERLTSNTSFKGTLTDQSYLEAIAEHSNANEIVPGEYYTITATVPLGYYGYSSKTVYLTCEVENDDFIVRFRVEFRDEFKDLVSAVEKGDEITFRGRFYETGCEFKDCELIK